RLFRPPQALRRNIDAGRGDTDRVHLHRRVWGGAPAAPRDILVLSGAVQERAAGRLDRTAARPFPPRQSNRTLGSARPVHPALLDKWRDPELAASTFRSPPLLFRNPP